jgi:pentatricopeptide repeat protein
MLFMATFVRAADVEICIGMIGVPLSLYLLNKNNLRMVPQSPKSCDKQKLLEDEVEPTPTEASEDQDEEEQSDAEQSPMEGSCSQSLPKDQLVESETPLPSNQTTPITEEPAIGEDTAASDTDAASTSDAELIDTLTVDKPDDDAASSEGAASDGASPSSKMCWADLEEEDDDFMNRLVQKKRPGLESDPVQQELEAPAVEAPEPNEGQAATDKPERGPKKPSILATIKLLGAEGKFLEAMTAVENAVASGGGKRTQLLNALLDSLIHAGHATQAGELFEQMKVKEDIDTVTYNIVLRSWLSEGRDIAEVKALLREMNSFGLAANAVTFNELLGDRARAGDRTGMWGIISKMCAAGGIGVNKVSLTILLKSLDDTTTAEEVKRTVVLLERLEENVDEVLRAAAAEACVRLKEPGRISEVMERLIENGGCDARPGMSAATYGGLIKAHGRAHDVKSAWETWNAMMKNNVRPTSITTGCMIEALVMNGSVDDAWALVQEMVADDRQCESINTVIYSTVLKGFAHAWKLERCFDVLAEMKGHGIQCNTITYNTLLDACTKCGQMDRISDVFNDMQRNGVEPDLITYSTLVKGFCQAGDLERAFELVQDVKQDGGLKLDEIVYNSLLDGCARQQKVDQAMEVLSDMRAASIVPSNYTLSILVKLLGRARHLKQAFSVVEELCGAYNIRLNVHVYTCLIQACLQNQKIDRALVVHDEMVKGLGREPDCKAYSVLLSGCLRAHAHDDAMRVAFCAYRIPGHGLAVPDYKPDGKCPGVEEDVLRNLDWEIKGSQKAHLIEALEDVKKASGYSGHSNSGWNTGRRYDQGYGNSSGQSHGKGKGKGKGKGEGKGRGKRH